MHLHLLGIHVRSGAFEDKRPLTPAGAHWLDAKENPFQRVAMREGVKHSFGAQEDVILQ
jgi:hypothetical protein